MLQYGDERASRVDDVGGDGGAFPERRHIETGGSPASLAQDSTRISPHGAMSTSIIDTKEISVVQSDLRLARSQIITPETRAKQQKQLQDAIDGKLYPQKHLTDLKGGNTHAQYIKYAPVGARERVIKVQQLQQDPLSPPAFRLKKAPSEAKPTAVAVVQSPPRKVTEEDKEAWRIPPSISNWKNSKGYTIPLDKRLAADGRGLVDVKINDNFAKFSEALYVAEQSARVSVETRANVQKQVALQEQISREQTIRQVAAQALRDQNVESEGLEEKLSHKRMKK